MKKTICILGGDERNYKLLELLKRKGHNIKTYEENEDMKTFFKTADCIVCGIPFTRDGKTINAPYIKNKIEIEDIFKNMEKQTTLVAGGFTEEIKALAKRYEIRLKDFLENEDFAVYNAIPTAEGALEIAMRETNYTINSSNCLILGYGRIGKVLADILKGMHANVTVAARKASDFAWIKAMGYRYISYLELNEILRDTDILFNTVPTLLIKEEELKHMKKECLIIDLSSKPGGIDFTAAKELGIKADLALGLPGKVAPKSVAEYMLNIVES